MQCCCNISLFRKIYWPFRWEGRGQTLYISAMYLFPRAVSACIYSSVPILGIPHVCFISISWKGRCIYSYICLRICLYVFSYFCRGWAEVIVRAYPQVSICSYLFASTSSYLFFIARICFPYLCLAPHLSPRFYFDMPIVLSVCLLCVWALEPHVFRRIVFPHLF